MRICDIFDDCCTSKKKTKEIKIEIRKYLRKNDITFLELKFKYRRQKNQKSIFSKAYWSSVFCRTVRVMRINTEEIGQYVLIKSSKESLTIYEKSFLSTMKERYSTVVVCSVLGLENMLDEKVLNFRYKFVDDIEYYV